MQMDIDYVKNNMIYFEELSTGWRSKKFFLNPDDHLFYEVKTHEEYLDCGTVLDGIAAVDDDIVWSVLVLKANEEGIEKYLSVRNNKRGNVVWFPNDGEICFEEFQKTIEGYTYEQSLYDILNRKKPQKVYDVERISDTEYIIRYVKDRQFENRLKKEKYFWKYEENKSKIGFVSKEAAFSFILGKKTDMTDMIC